MDYEISPNITKIVTYSSEEAHRLRCDTVVPAHLMLGMMREEDCTAMAILRQMGVDFRAFKAELERISKGTSDILQPELNDDCNRILRLMFLEARAMKAAQADTEHLLLALLRSIEEPATRMLKAMDIDYPRVKNALTQTQDTPQAGFGFTDEDEDDEEEDNDLHNTGRPGQQGATKTATRKGGKENGTPALDTFGTDLTRAAAEGLLDPVVGREREIERVAQILCRRKKNNPILIGQPGVGKSAIVEGLALRIVQRKVARLLFDKRVIVLDLAGVVAGTKYRGQFEERPTSCSPTRRSSSSSTRYTRSLARVRLPAPWMPPIC